jgi:hypothetical protein
MRERLTVIAAAMLLCAVAAPRGEAQGSTLARARMRNDVGIELLGKAAVYSFSYQRMVSPAVGLEIGLGALGGGSSTDNSMVVFFPAGAKIYLIPKDGALYVTGGAVLVTAAVESGPFGDSAADFYGHAGLGFEFRSAGGFLFRGTAYGLFGGGGYFIWPGLSVGYAF